jgi:hypothetical protein
MQKFLRFRKLGQVPYFLLSLMKPRIWGPLLHAFNRTRFDHDFSVSWSQCGEDLALVALLDADKRQGIYVDVGAHHPDRFSVTRALYERGWRGINIDADGDANVAFMKKRPRDSFLLGAVGTKEYYDFYRSNERAVSTVRQDWMEKYSAAGFLFEEKKRIKGLKLRPILESLSSRVDLLNIDIEGADSDAITSIDFDNLNEDYWPEWIMVESSPPLKTVLNIDSVAYLISKNYEIWTILPMVTILRRTT